MKVRFYLDAETGLPHIYKHGVREDEVEDALTSPGEDRIGREGARVVIGRSRAGRYLRVIYVPEEDGAFVIAAYELMGKALTAYRRRGMRLGGR